MVGRIALALAMDFDKDDGRSPFNDPALMTYVCSLLSSTLRYRFGTVVSNEPGEHSLSPGLVIHGVNLPSCMALVDGLAEIRSIFSLVRSSSYKE